MDEKLINQTEEITIEDTTNTEDVTTEETTEEETEIVFGEVVGCKNLNIRKKPVVNPTNVLCIVPEGTLLSIIEPEKATKEWYKVELEDGAVGFCMKEFVFVSE